MDSLYHKYFPDDLELFQVLKGNGISVFDSVEGKTIQTIKEAINKLDAYKKEALVRIKPKFDSSVENQQFFGADSSFYLSNRVLTLVNSRIQSNVGKIPIAARGVVLFDGLRYQKEYSAIGIEFEVTSFREMAMQELKGLKMNEPSCIDDVLRLSKLNGEEQQLMLNDLKANLIETLLRRPEYQDLKARIQDTLGALKSAITDSMEVGKKRLLDSVYNKHSKFYNRLESLEKQYHQIWAQKQLLHESLKTSKDKMNQLVDEVKLWKNPNFLRSQVQGKAFPQVQNRLLGSIEGLSIGNAVINFSPTTIQNMPVKGGQLKGRTKYGFYEVAGGVQAMTLQYGLIHGNSFWSQFYGNKVLAARVGWGDPDSSYIDLKYVRFYPQTGRRDSSLILLPENQVTGVSMQKGFNQFSNISFDYSICSNSGSTPDQNYSLKDKSAIELKYNLLQKSSLSFSAGLFFVGNRFSILGNPFLLPGTKGIQVAFSKSFYKNKLSFSGQLRWLYQYQRSIVSSVENQTYQWSTSLIYRPTKNLDVQFFVSPNYFKQNAFSKGEISAQSNLYMMNVNTTLAKGKYNFNLTLTNTNTNFQLIDTSNFHNIFYGIIQQRIHLNEHTNLVSTLLSGYDVASYTFSDYNFSFGVQLARKKIVYTVQSLWTKFRYEASAKPGLNQSFFWNVHKNIQIGLQSNLFLETGNERKKSFFSYQGNLFLKTSL